jgi:hypothetical protein
VNVANLSLGGVGGRRLATERSVVLLAFNFFIAEAKTWIKRRR